MVNACRHRRFLAEIAAEVQQDEIGVLLQKSADELGCAIAAAVVHVDQFPGKRQRPKRLGHAPVEFHNHCFFVKDRNDSGKKVDRLRHAARARQNTDSPPSLLNRKKGSSMRWANVKMSFTGRGWGTRLLLGGPCLSNIRNVAASGRIMAKK